MQFLRKHNLAADTPISFVYHGGTDPGTRRTVMYLGMHELRSGQPGFRGLHDDRPKLYELAKCSGMQLACVLQPDPATPRCACVSGALPCTACVAAFERLAMELN